MKFQRHRFALGPRRLFVFALALICATMASWVQPVTAEDTNNGEIAKLAQQFSESIQPFLNQHCVRCHNPEKLTSGIRVDHLDASLADRHLKLWTAIQQQIIAKAMPPEDEPQPPTAQRERVAEWITKSLAAARSRPAAKNGGARRLTVAQYRNTLRELLLLEDELADLLPPDAVSRDGFVNNQETLQLSPLLLEAYFDIAEEALRRCTVDSQTKPTIQNFRLDFGEGINREPCPDQLILGAGSLLLDNEDFVVTQLAANKPFPFEPFSMRTKYRFNEGYQGNGTVRGWREYDSIYHAVYACMRGTNGYPKGRAYSTTAEGLLLRPAIPSAELFQVESTYGPRANFKISLRELPDHGRFRVTVTAAKYNDGLLLEPSDRPQPTDQPNAVISRDLDGPQSITLPQAGIYQVDMHLQPRDAARAAPDASRLQDERISYWPFDKNTDSVPQQLPLAGKLLGDARLENSPFGQAVWLGGYGDGVAVAASDALNVGTGDFTVSAWINPRELVRGGIIGRGKHNGTHGWHLEMPNNQGLLRLEAFGPENQRAGIVSTAPGILRGGEWQHVAAVVKRGKGGTRLYVNGWPVATGTVNPLNLDNPQLSLMIGRVEEGQPLQGEIDEVHFFRRALDEGELQALVDRGRQFVTRQPPEKTREVTLRLGDREFTGDLKRPAFLALRLPSGELNFSAKYAGISELERIVFTPLDETSELARRYLAFEQRTPRLGVYLGLRRDCGSTLAPVEQPKTVASSVLSRYVFEGAIRNFPSPDVQPDNDNYLAGIREIGVHSEYTDGRDMPRLLIRSVEFEGPLYDTWPPPTHRNLFSDVERPADLPASAKTILHSFATRAFRRPLTKTEAANLFAVYEKSFATSGNFQESVKDALLVILTSPQFLFLIENSHSPAPEPLDEYELASKLSYFLWNSPPDAELLRLAANSELRSSLDSQADRFIDNPKFSRFISEFASQWLALDKFAVLEPERGRFPKLTRDARTQLREEPVQFLQYLIRNNLPAKNLISSDVLMANEVVANYYDLADQSESGFQFLPIAHGRQDLGGVLSQAAILAGLSDGRESNPVKRGAWLARRIIAEPPDDPPPNVPALKEAAQDLSLRERLEMHRNQPGCAQCHSKIDPWGLPLEEYDAGGRLKTQAVDARSTLPDKAQVTGAADLKRYLAEDRIDQVAFSVLKHLAIYASGRSLTHNELEWLRQSSLELKTDSYRMGDLIKFVIRSPIFLEK